MARRGRQRLTYIHNEYRKDLLCEMKNPVAIGNETKIDTTKLSAFNRVSAPFIIVSPFFSFSVGQKMHIPIT